MRNLWKFLCVLLAALVLATGVFGCRQQAQTESATGGSEKIAYYALNSEPILDWDPSVEFSNGIVVLHNIYETLLRYDPVVDTFQYVLATEYSHSEDGLTWTFKLRDGVKFQDGTVMDAAAVKFSFDRTINMEQGASYIWDSVDSISTPDDRTVEFSLKYPAPLDLIVSAGYAAFVMSPTAVQNNSEDWLSKGNVCGTGPYTLQSFKMGDEVVLSAFPDYWGGWDGNHVKTVYIKKVPEFASRRQMVEKGDASIISHISPEDNKTLRGNPALVVDPVDGFQNLLLFFNTAKAPLDNVKLRQALSYAFPYSDAVEHALGGEAQQGRGVIPHGLWGQGDDVLQYSYDLDRAKALLAEAGYPDGGLEFVVTYMSGEEGEKRSLELYQSELAKLNIKLELRAMPWDSQWEMAKNPDPSQVQDMFTMYWWPDYASPYSWLFNLFHSEEDTLYNMSYYSNPKYDELIDDANVLSGTDRAAAERMFIEAQQILMEDAVTIPIFDMKNTLVHRANFKGFVDNPAYPNVVFFYDTYFD